MTLSALRLVLGLLLAHLREARWFTLNDTVVKLNADGSSLGNLGRTGVGGIVRNHLGEWVSGFSGSCSIAMNLYVELLAIATGLRLAWDAGHMEIILDQMRKWHCS